MTLVNLSYKVQMVYPVVYDSILHSDFEFTTGRVMLTTRMFGRKESMYIYDTTT